MYWNSYSVVVPEGKEHGGYVELSHGQVYTVRLKNDRDVRCDVKLEIDGQDIGTWRLNSHEGLTLERPAHDDGRFTFYKVGTPEAQKVNSETYSPNHGLVKAVFTPERHSVHQRPLTLPWYPTNNWGLYRTTTTGSTDASRLSASINGPQDYDVAMAAMPVSESQVKGLSAGVTGLTGKSDQKFVSTYALNYDYSQQTTIHLRLVHGDSNEPRPLTSHSTPIPPLIQ